MAISSADAIKAIAAIEKQLAALRVFAGMPVVAVAVAVKSKPAASTETKRVLSPLIVKMNEERAAVFEELKETWALAHPDFASLDDKALALAVKNGEVEARPRFSDALQEHGRRARADNPEKQAKYEAYRAKVDAEQAQKKGSASVSSGSSAPKPEPVADVKKRKPQSEETKAAAAIKRAATKAAKLSAPAASVNPFDDAPLPSAPAGAEVVQLYVSPPAAVGGPPKMLKGFQKALLAPGEARTLVFSLSAADLAVFDVSADAFVLVPGSYGVLAAAAADDIRLSSEVDVG